MVLNWDQYWDSKIPFFDYKMCPFPKIVGFFRIRLITKLRGQRSIVLHPFLTRLHFHSQTVTIYWGQCHTLQLCDYHRALHL